LTDGKTGCPNQRILCKGENRETPDPDGKNKMNCYETGARSGISQRAMTNTR
jgi:hypothetical protein